MDSTSASKEIKNKPCRNNSGLNASVDSAILNFSNKLKDVFSEQLGLLKGSKVTTSWHQSVGVDVVILGLGPSLWGVYQLSWEGSKARGYKYTSSARGSEKVNYLWEHEIIAPTSDNWPPTLNPPFCQCYSPNSPCRSAWKGL